MQFSNLSFSGILLRLIRLTSVVMELIIVSVLEISDHTRPVWPAFDVAEIIDASHILIKGSVVLSVVTFLECGPKSNMKPVSQPAEAVSKMFGELSGCLHTFQENS